MTAAAVRVSLESIDENATVISQKLDYAKILSSLREKNIFNSEQLERLENPAVTVIEKTGYLLQCLKKLQQKGVDMFMEGLRETGSAGHREIITLLEETVSEEPAPSPLLEVFETKKADILSRISFATFMNKLIEMEVVSMHENMEIYNPHRSPDENCLALIELLMKRPGSDGLLKFIECLHEDANPEHNTLATILHKEALSVVHEHPRRSDIPQGDKTQLLLLERWREVGTPTDVAIKKAFRNYEQRLKKEVNVSVLLPLLVRRRVVTVEEEASLNQLKPEERAPQLVAVVGDKGMRSIVSFVECIRQSPQHEKLARLFEMTAAKKVPAKSAAEKTSKLAVMVTMSSYLHMVNDYEAEEKKMYSYNHDFEEYRENLHVCLERLEFTVIDFTDIISKQYPEGISSNPNAINTSFDKEVASHCNKDAIVFIYICGHQFPLKLKKGVREGEERYSGAVLLDGASELSRRSSECIDMNNLKYWVELLPTDHVTFLIDCHHSHVVRYGKQRLPSEVEIMTNPWSSLTESPGVVLYFCQPDPKAMWRLRGTYREDDSVFGKLTEIFVKALISWIRRGHKMEVSHRLFYESISFHWHKKGRVHKLFVPAIQGDVDRSFLGTSSYPYLQVLRADLVRSEGTGGPRYDLTKLQVATGTQLGLIKDDELVVFHILHPEVKVGGRITRAHPLSSIAEVLKDEREKFSRLLDHIYEDEEVSEDGSTEFVLVKKKFPFHLRDNYAVFCQEVPESDMETIKDYIKKTSHLLSYAPNIELARLLVRKKGQYFTVEDREMKTDKEGKRTRTNDIVFSPRVKTIQNVKSVLEIMAWFKHVKNLRTQTDLNHFLCYLVCEKPLLTPSSAPTTDQYQIRASSQTGPHRANEAILQFSDDPHFWCPQPNDHTPTLEVEFSENRVVTAVEVRGDSDVPGHITQAELNYRRLVFHRDCTAPEAKKLETIAMETSEKAWFVVIKPQDWDRGSEFCLAIRLVVSTPGHDRGRVRAQGVSSLMLLHWKFLSQNAGWTISPVPTITSEGHAQLDLSRTENMLRWSGRTPTPLTFDLDKELLVEKIEISCVPGTKPLRKFRVELYSQWLSELTLSPFPSTWPCKKELQRPLIISNLQLCPVKWSEVPFRAQLQIYGNTHGSSMVVEERDILQLHFVNYTKQCQFVYLYFLEETGKIEMVMADVVNAQSGLKKLIRVHIPDGYDPVAKKITDHYRVIVSPKKVFLEPLNQLGLHEYLGVRSYNPCYIGRRTDIGKDEQWNEYKFEVVVKKGASHILS